MFKEIMTVLKSQDFKGEKEIIDIAKGKYKIPRTYKEAYKQFKRDLAWLSKEK